MEIHDWRYRTVYITSTLPNQNNRTNKHFINAFGEEVIIDNAEQALTKACCETGAEIKDYTAGPIYFKDEKAGGHEWIITSSPNALIKCFVRPVIFIRYGANEVN